jgi:hypothetical protein
LKSLKSEKLGETVRFAKEQSVKSADRHWIVNSFEPDKFHQTARTALTVRINGNIDDVVKHHPARNGLSPSTRE